MKQYFFAAAILFLNACHNNDTEKKITPVIAEEKQDFFPVTAYLKGQIADILQKGLTPRKYTTINNKTDSVMVKFEELNELCKEFLHPEIDSVNLVPLFKEEKFLDQSVDAFTFMYDPKGALPDSMQLKRWDVYIDPQSSKVKRIYMLKKNSENKILQLTWQSDQWCKITTIKNISADSSTIEKEEKISWDY
jgi:hypothetical protein